VPTLLESNNVVISPVPSEMKGDDLIDAPIITSLNIPSKTKQHINEDFPYSNT
jgi:hypothetical protein